MRLAAGLAARLAAPLRAEDRATPQVAAATQGVAFGADRWRIGAARRVAAPGRTFPNSWPDALLPLAAARHGICPTTQESERP